MLRKTSFIVAFTLFLFSMPTFAFNIQPASASGTIYIRADGSVDPPTANITSVDNITYTFTGNIYDSIVVERDNIVVDGAGYTLQVNGGWSSRGISLSGRSNVTIKNVEVKKFTTGIYLSYCSNNVLIGNTVSSNSIGIRLQYSNNSVLIGNTASSNAGCGIFLSHSNNNVLTGNTAFSNFFEGIYLPNSNNSILMGNTVFSNHRGISLATCSNNVLIGNTASSNTAGIFLDSSSSNNVLIGNTVSSNHDGIEILSSSSMYACRNNTFFHNNLINNTDQAGVTTGYVNTWDNGVEGNYWSDYNGTDFFSGPFQNETGSDGIGDTLYEVDGNNTDNYPLMGMFSSFNTSLGYDVNVISNSTIEDFEYFESNSTIKMYVSNMTTNQTFGFCRVCIPHALMDDPDVVRIIIDDGQTEVLFANLALYDNSTHRWIYFAYEHSTHEVIIQSDTTPPTISILSPENKTYSENNIPLTFTVDESTDWIGYSLDGQMNVTIAGNITLASLLDGAHYVVVYANDTAGNMGSSNIICFTVDATPPNITDVSQTPPKNNVLPEDEVKVNATVTDDLSGIKQVTLNYTNSNGTWITVDMTNLEGNVWNATIPKFPYCTNVTYLIITEDKANNAITTEDMGYEYQYHVIPEFPSFLTLPLFMIAALLAVKLHRRKHFM